MTRTFVTMFGIDLATKQLAYWFLPSWTVFNTEVSKIGMTSAEHIVTSIMLCAMLAVIGTVDEVRDARPWIGSAIGGSLANLASYVSGPPGVLDFIPLGPLVANFADFAIWVGVIGMVYVVARQALTRL